MRRKSNWYFVHFLLFFILFPALPCLGKEKKAAASHQDLVWSQSDGLRHEIFFSKQQNGEWSDPVKITDNNADNLHPVLDIATDGTKWIFWSAIRPNGISIEYASFQKEKEEWSEPQKLPMEQNSSIAPSVLADKKNRIWLVWAGNDGGNDDIYFTCYQNKKKAWSDPQVIHASNEVPDIKPEIAYTEEGKIEVSWIGFRGNMYKKLTSVYTDKTGWSAEQEKVERKEEDVQKRQEQETDLPSFLPSDSQFLLKIY
ncbi:MAG: hypothetical protein D3909_14230 [Candidatus Electrothrix sp. ATG1]|nr:hypothetical protein [Candidatus Electrothrix sp. ATG1]